MLKTKALKSLVRLFHVEKEQNMEILNISLVIRKNV